MPVSQRSKFFISLASFPVTCLFTGSLLAQVETVSDVPQVFESVSSIEANALPIPPRHLPAFRSSEIIPPETKNPFANQFKQAYGEPAKPALDQPDGSSTEPSKIATSLSNWRQKLDNPNVVLDQGSPKISWSTPLTPTPADASSDVVTPFVQEPIRVARAETLGSGLSPSSAKGQPTNEFTLPVFAAAETVQQPQSQFGEFEPESLTLTPPEGTDELGTTPLPESWGILPSQASDAIVPDEIEPEIPMIPATPQEPLSQKPIWDQGITPLPVSEPANDFNPDQFSSSVITKKTPAPQLPAASRNESLVWWKEKIQAATIPGGTLQSVETNSLVFLMLKRSPHLQAVSQNPLIREQRITEAEADFDPVRFLRSQWQDRVDPVGDNLSLTNDGTNFLDDHIWTSDMGIRKKTTTGATVELNQRLGFRNSNSRFFNPQDQGTAALSLNVTQPLLRGRGKYYNRSQILIAQAATNASWDTLAIELQDEIQSVVESYWRLYFDRCVFLQKQENVKRAQTVLAKLEGRAELDSLPYQIARARSAVRSRTTELANARRDIRNSETDIRRLTADSDWAGSQMIELLPTELPDLSIPIADLEQVIVTAIENRPEIRETLKRSKIAAIQRDISINELMPELSLLMGTYVSALQGNSQLGDAFIDQFGSVKPGYSVGVEFEMPIRNRAARSRLTQRKLQMNLIKAEIQETMQNVIAESQIARRRVASAKQTLVAATEAILAARLDLEQNEGRWESFALIEGDIVEGQTPTIVLDQLLDSQTRLVEAEFVYTQAEMELKIAEIALQRTMGTLLTHQSVDYSRSNTDDDTPAVDFNVAR